MPGIDLDLSGCQHKMQEHEARISTLERNAKSINQCMKESIEINE
jgi:hypothetical protein